MAALTVTTLEQFGEGADDVGFEAVDAGLSDTIPDDGQTVVLVRNTSGGAITGTVTMQANARTYNEAGTKVITVAATTGQGVIGPFRRGVFGSGGNVTITWSASAGVTAAALKIPPQIQ